MARWTFRVTIKADNAQARDRYDDAPAGAAIPRTRSIQDQRERQRQEIGWLIGEMAEELETRDFPAPFGIDDLHRFYLGLLRKHGVAAAFADATARCELVRIGVFSPLPGLERLRGRGEHLEGKGGTSG